MSTAQLAIVVTGTAWMGSGIGAIETALERVLTNAQREIQLTAYALSPEPDYLADHLEAALLRGVEVTAVANRLNDQPPQTTAKLRALVAAYPHFRLYSFAAANEGDLHAKVVVADRSVAIVGSSNLTRRGLLLNHELAAVIRGSPAADVARAIDLLCLSPHVLRVAAH